MKTLTFIALLFSFGVSSSSYAESYSEASEAIEKELLRDSITCARYSLDCRYYHDGSLAKNAMQAALELARANEPDEELRDEITRLIAVLISKDLP